MYTWRLNMTSKSWYFCRKFVFGEFVVASSQSRNKFRQFISIFLDQIDWQLEFNTAMTALHDFDSCFRFGIQSIYTFYGGAPSGPCLRDEPENEIILLVANLQIFSFSIEKWIFICPFSRCGPGTPHPQVHLRQDHL